MYSNLFVFLLKCYILFGIDFGFCKHKTVYSKYCLVLPCIIQCLVYYYYYDTYPGIIQLIQHIYTVAYVLYVIIITKNVILISNNSVYHFRTELYNIDFNLKCFSASEYVDKKVLLVLIAMLFQKVLRFTVIYSKYHLNSSTIIPTAYIYSVIIPIEAIFVINTYIFYSIYNRLTILTSNVNNTIGSILPFIHLYRSISNVAVKYKSAFDPVVSLKCFCYSCYKYVI